MEKYSEKINYIDIKNLQNFTKQIKKFLTMTFLKKKNNNLIKNKHIYKNKNNSSLVIKKIFEKHTKKIIKSLSFNLSDGDEQYS